MKELKLENVEMFNSLSRVEIFFDTFKFNTRFCALHYTYKNT